MAEDPRMQGMFDKVVQQGLQGVTSPEVSGSLAEDAMQRGPEQAIAEAVVQVLNGVKQSAAEGGVELPPDVMQAAAVAIAQVLVAMMVDSGMADDPDTLLRMVVEQLKG